MTGSSGRGPSRRCCAGTTRAPATASGSGPCCSSSSGGGRIWPPALGDSRRAVASTLGTQVVRLMLAMAAGVVLSRALHPAGRGTYCLLTTVASTAQVLGHLSLEKAQIAFWPSACRDSLVANSVLLGTVLGLAAALGGWLAVPGSSGLLLVALAGVPAGILVINLTNIATLQS